MTTTVPPAATSTIAPAVTTTTTPAAITTTSAPAKTGTFSAFVGTWQIDNDDGFMIAADGTGAFRSTAGSPACCSGIAVANFRLTSVNPTDTVVNGSVYSASGPVANEPPVVARGRVTFFLMDGGNAVRYVASDGSSHTGCNQTGFTNPTMNPGCA